MNKKGFMTGTLESLKKSFSYSNNLKRAFFYQAAGFFAILAGIFFFIKEVFIPKYAELSYYKDAIEQIRVNPDAVSSGQLNGIEQIVSSLQIYLVIGLVAIAIIYLVFKYFVWLNIWNKKFSKRSALRFLVINISIPIAIYLIGLLLFYLFKPTIFIFVGLPITLFLLFQFSGVCNSAAGFKGLKKTIEECSKIGVKKAHKFLIPHLFAFIVFALLFVFMIFVGSSLQFLLDYSLLVRRTILIVLGFAFSVLYIAFFVWQKNYLSVVYKVQKKSKK
ncbi:MAG: hypothetical protein ACQESF_04260 [Nanobdellota archaeon]